MLKLKRLVPQHLNSLSLMLAQCGQVPLRRVNQSYVIATSTKVDVSSADLSALTDEKFTPQKKAKKKGGDDFFEQAPEGKKVTFTSFCFQSRHPTMWMQLLHRVKMRILSLP